MSRAIATLDLVSTSSSGMTAAEIARGLGIPVATAHHLLNTLVDSAALSKHERRYHLGPKIGVLGEALFRANYAPAHLRPALERLAGETGETVYLSAWRHGEIVVLAVAEGSHSVMVAGPAVGFSGYAHARASGKVLLATLDPAAFDLYLAGHPLEAMTPNTIVDEAELGLEVERAREQAYAVDDEEFREGVSCVAAPVRAGDTTVAVITLSAPSSRFHANASEYTASVVATARSAARLDGS